MIILQTKDLTKSFGVQRVFANINMIIQEKEKVGLVGPNGAGKTTFLRCLTGEESPEAGEIIKGEMIKVGYLEQIPEYAPTVTLFEAVLDTFADILAQREELKRLENLMSQAQGKELEQTMARYSRLTEEYERANGFSCEAMTRRIVTGLGFSEADLGRAINSFSGGEKTKVSIARLLIRGYDLLLLDEPTNHLDIQAVEWLEDFLKDYPGAVLVISHDRYFLDQVTERTLELAEGSLTSFAGNYSRFLRLKEEKTLAQAKAYEKQQKSIEATEAYIEKYRAGIKSKQARGRESQLSRLERIAKPTEARSIKLGGSQTISESANVVLKVADLSHSFAQKKLWENLNFTINKGEKVALIGPNGVGKSTLLKVIKRELEPQKGKIILGARVKIGFFDQEHNNISAEKRVIDELLNNEDSGLTINQARDILGSFLFQGDDVFKEVKNLSGGERGRLAFLKLYLAKPNLLILDEPTNHLDIASKNVIEEYLAEYPGTILVVSHDRYFLDKITGRTLELTGTALLDYLGNYTYYREKKAQKAKELEAAQLVAKEKPRLNKQKLKQNKAQTREKINHLEKEIEKTEERIKELSGLLAQGDTYKDEEMARVLVAEYKELEENLPHYYVQWEELLQQLAAAE